MTVSAENKTVFLFFNFHFFIFSFSVFLFFTFFIFSFSVFFSVLLFSFSHFPFFLPSDKNIRKISQGKNSTKMSLVVVRLQTFVIYNTLTHSNLLFFLQGTQLLNIKRLLFPPLKPLLHQNDHANASPYFLLWILPIGTRKKQTFFFLNVAEFCETYFWHKMV